MGVGARCSSQKCADAVTFQTRSGHGIIDSRHFAFANERRHCHGKDATEFGERCSQQRKTVMKHWFALAFIAWATPSLAAPTGAVRCYALANDATHLTLRTRGRRCSFSLCGTWAHSRKVMPTARNTAG
jgi:hypothetical protein